MHTCYEINVVYGYFTYTIYPQWRIMPYVYINGIIDTNYCTFEEKFTLK